MIRLPDVTLHGNHDTCPACELRREVQDKAPICRAAVPCNVCGGTGFLKLTVAEIVRRTCEEARRLYWPVVYARWASSDPRSSHDAAPPSPPLG